MTDNRRFLRIECGLVVSLKDQRGTTELMTSNVSLHGVHVITDHPSPDRQLVQLTFNLGGFGEVQVMGMVAWTRKPGLMRETDLPGMGVEFFAMPKGDKERWTQFVHALKDAGEAKAAEEGESADEDMSAGAGAKPPPIPAAALKPPPIPDAALKPLPVRRQHPRFISCFMLQIKTRELLREMYTRDISVGGMFVATPTPDRVNKSVQLVLVHPATKDKFQLAGQVVRVQSDGQPKERGVALKLAPLPTEREAALLAFIESGVNYLQDESGKDLGREAQLSHAIKMVQDSGSSLALLGFALMKSQDTKEAAEAFCLSLEHSPDVKETLKGLHEAYLLMGDHEQADQVWERLSVLDK